MNSSRNVTIARDACGWPILKPMTSGLDGLRYLDLITYPYLLLLCTVGNFFTLTVLCKRDAGRPRSKSVYVIAIAVVDLCYMWISLVSYVHSYDGEVRGFPSPGVDSFYNQLAGVQMFLQETLSMSSAWLIVAFSTDRFLAIRFPMVHLKSNAKRSTRVAIGIVLVSALIATVRLVDYYRYYDLFLRLEPRPVRPPPRPKWLLGWYSAYLWAEAIIQIVTFIVILVLNIWLLYTILYQRRLRRNSLHVQISADRAKRSDWSTLPMLAACVVLFLITKTPELIDNFIFLLEKGCLAQSSVQLKAVIKSISNLMENLNYSLNFILYCGVDGKFRQKIGGLVNSWRAASEVKTQQLRHVLGPAHSQGTKSTGSAGSNKS